MEQKYTTRSGGKVYSVIAGSENEAIRILVDRYRINPWKMEYLTHEEVGKELTQDIGFVQGKNFKSFCLVLIDPLTGPVEIKVVKPKESVTRPWFQLDMSVIK